MARSARSRSERRARSALAGGRPRPARLAGVRHHPAGGRPAAAELGADPRQRGAHPGRPCPAHDGAASRGWRCHRPAADGVRRPGAQPRPPAGQRPADLGRRARRPSAAGLSQRPVAARSSPTSTPTCRWSRPGATLTWVYTTDRRLPAHARPFALVGDQPVAAGARRHPAARSIRASVSRAAGHARRLAIALHNVSGVPQYQLQVYAFAQTDGRYVAAGNLTVPHLGSQASVTGGRCSGSSARRARPPSRSRRSPPSSNSEASMDTQRDPPAAIPRDAPPR